MTTRQTNTSGRREVANADDVLSELIQPDLGWDGVRTGLGFTEDFSQPSVTIGSGVAAAMQEGGASVYKPETVEVSLIDNATNYIYLRSTSEGLQYFVSDNKTSPETSAVYIGYVDTEDNDLREENRGLSAVLSDVEVSAVGDEVHIKSVNDLPYPSNGIHTLDSSKSYVFEDFVISANQLDPNGALLRGLHGSQGGFIYMGNGAAIKSSSAFFAEEFYAHAPGATLFDLDADSNTEMLVQSCAFSDAAGLGNMASLGTISGYRVPTFKGCNFENFDEGFTLTGTCDKVFFEGCPLRTITESGVTIFSFDSDFECDIVDYSNNYVKGVQSDTVVVNVDPEATVNDIFQYRGVTHDSTVTEANILTGAASVDSVGYRVSDSYPLSTSKSFIDYTLDTPTDTTINTQANSKIDEDAYQRISGSTTQRGAARFTHSNNEATYVGKRDRVGEITAILSVGTGTSDVVAAAWFHDGSLVSGTATRAQMSQQGGGIDKPILATGVDGNLDTGDVLDVRVANLGSTTDITVGELNAKITT